MGTRISLPSFSPLQGTQSPYAEHSIQPQGGCEGGSQAPGVDCGNSLAGEELLGLEIIEILAQLTQGLESMSRQFGQAGAGGGGGSPGPACATSPPGADFDSAPSTAPSPVNGGLGPKAPTALRPYLPEINAAAAQTGVPASLIGAQILQESGGNPNAVTTNPALGLPDTGLMQIDQKTFEGLQQQYPNLLAGKSVSDPATNILAGALLDAQLLKQHNGDVGAALTAYNGGFDSSYVNEVTAKMTALQNGTPVPGGFS